MKIPTFVTQPFLPPLEEFIPYLQQIWDTKMITNNGPFAQQLEIELSEYLEVPFVSLFSNGTIALITALQALDIKGEVITTPYSFVATSNALLWNGAKPVFVDIEPRFLNLDPAKIEAAITENTQAILAVHCYGNPCDVENIARIADKHNLKVIYDAAHAFGVKRNGGVLNQGDLSVLSLHATKVFNTFEGGAIICSDPAIKARIDGLRNFGFAGEIELFAPGMNGKFSEFNAALGLLQLKYIDEVIEKRRAIDNVYRMRLNYVNGISLIDHVDGIHHNYIYFPILVGDDYPLSRDDLLRKLQSHGINPRRYFYPLISDFAVYRDYPSANGGGIENARRAAEQILCLPIYPDLEMSSVDEICELIADRQAEADRDNSVVRVQK